MPRPPLVIGTWGEISRAKQGKGWVAIARFRDYDGITRQVRRTGPTGRRAEDALVEALRDRSRVPGADMSRDTYIRDLATAWMVEFESMERAPQTVERYQRVLRSHVLPGLGGNRIWEASVPAIDRFLADVRKNAGPAPARLSRVVLRGMFGLAVRHGAVPTNPVRDTSTVPRAKGEVKVVEFDEVHLLRQRLREWDAGRDRAGNLRVTDLADPIDLFLATGVRTGELLALRWDDVVLGAKPTARFTATAVQLPGVGLYRQERPKTDTSNRIIRLPLFAVEMLQRRRRDASGECEWVFPSSTGTLRSPSNFRRQWRDFRSHEVDGEPWYPDWVTPKTFRKTVATRLRDEVGLEAASGQLGHSGTKVTAEHYAKRVFEAPDHSDVLQAFSA